MRINLVSAINRFIVGSIVYLCGIIVMLMMFSLSLLISFMIYDALIKLIKFIF